MKIPLHRLNKQKIVWLGNHLCRHKHTYLEHYNCYSEEQKEEKEHIGFLDIEASNLDANFGIMYSWCIKDSNSKKIYSDVLKPEDKRFPPEKSDRRIVESLIKCMFTFDRIIGHYSSRFDIPYTRTRALICDVEFPPYGSLNQDDTWQIARNKLKLNSNRLETVCETLFGETQKTHLKSKYWIGAMRFDKKSLEYILDHNRKDVLDLERVYNKIKDYIKLTNKSI
jgi:DNA polymerase elongation subunit (family B)